MASKGTVPIKVVLSVIIHDTDASLRFGGDGYKLTFAGTEMDKEQAAKLILLKKTPLRLTIELDDGNTQQEQTQDETGKDGAAKGGRRPWLERKSRGKAERGKADG